MKFNLICANTRVAILESLFKERYYENNLNVVKKKHKMKSPKEAEKVFLICYAIMVFKRYLDIS